MVRYESNTESGGRVRVAHERCKEYERREMRNMRDSDTKPAFKLQLRLKSNIKTMNYP